MTQSSNPQPGSRRLDSWKEIAEFLGRDVRSAQRWERERGLPVHRVPGTKGGAVFAYVEEVESWLRSGNGKVTSAEAGSGVAANGYPRRVSMLVALGAVILAAGVLCVLLIVRTGWFTTKDSEASHSHVVLAVLPFQNLSGDASQEYFVDGLTEEMITDLGQLNPGALAVIARTSSMKYKGTHEDVSQIGRELGANYVLEGSVRREGDQARISAQLIQVSDQTHVWAQSYQAQVKDILGVQQDVAQNIADKIRIHLNGPGITHASGSHPASADAYDNYLKGLYFWNRRDPASLAECVKSFDQSIAQDPNYGPAYSGLARCHSLLGVEGLAARQEAYSKGEAAALKAIELDESSAEAHTALAGFKVLYAYDWSGGKAEFLRALTLNPNYALAHHWYANLYLDPEGDNDDAIAEMKLAQELDPMSLVINTDLGYAYYLAGECGNALAQFRKVAAMDPMFGPAYNEQVPCYELEGNYDTAFEEKHKALGLLAPNVVDTADRIYRTAGYRGLLKVMADSQGTLNLESRKGHETPWGTAECYALLGEKDKAVAALEKSYERREPGMIYLKVNPLFASLHSEPQFIALERKMGFEP